MIYDLAGTQFNLLQVFSISEPIRSDYATLRITIYSVGGAKIEVFIHARSEEIANGGYSYEPEFEERVKKEISDMINIWEQLINKQS